VCVCVCVCVCKEGQGGTQHDRTCEVKELNSKERQIKHVRTRDCAFSVALPQTVGVNPTHMPHR